MPGNGFGEFDLIRRLERLTAAPFASSRHILLGIGDDAAVLKQTRGHLWLATTDLLAEHIHFDLTYTSYDKLGYKAAAVNFSDIAAMGGMPRFILVAMALSRHQTPRDVENLYRGIQSACQDVGAIVVGGDTSASKKDLFLAVTVLGEAPSRNILRRSGARPGDHVYVTGSLGDARAGLEILREGPKRFDEGNRSAKGLSYLTRRHLSPHPRFKEAQCLAKTTSPAPPLISPMVSRVTSGTSVKKAAWALSLIPVGFPSLRRLRVMPNSGGAMRSNMRSLVVRIMSFFLRCRFRK